MGNTVLLVDDQAYSFLTLADWLRPHELKLEKVIDATAGLMRAAELHASGDLAALLTDIIMKPGDQILDETGGREAGVLMAEELRRRGVNEPIFFYSVVTDEAIRAKADSVCNSVFMSKLPPRQVTKKIVSQLRRRPNVK